MTYFPTSFTNYFIFLLFFFFQIPHRSNLIERITSTENSLKKGEKSRFWCKLIPVSRILGFVMVQLNQVFDKWLF